MFPPGRIMFLRPIKVFDRQRGRNERQIKSQWDCIWVTPQELIQEGILISKKVKPLSSRDQMPLSLIGPELLLLLQGLQTSSCLWLCLLGGHIAPNI